MLTIGIRGYNCRLRGELVTYWRIIIRLPLALIGPLAFASPEPREPHLRWRDSHEPPVARWFIPGPLGYEAGEAPLPSGERAFLSRSFSGLRGGDELEWMHHNGLGPPPAFSHNLSRVIPNELFEAHPELFPLIGGRRWRPEAPGVVNWNPDLGEEEVAEYAANAAKAYFSDNPNALSFALGVNDGLRFGESAATLRWVYPPRYFRGRPNYSDLVFNFMNRVAERMTPEHPDRYLGALAYYWCEQVPSFPVHPKVMPFLTADRSQGYDPAFRREEEALQRRWADAGPERLGIYDYIYGHGFLVPRIHTALLARNLRHARRVGFDHYYAELYPNWGLDGPQPWLVAQLLQDPEQSRVRLLDEYYRRFFRKAARPMRRFFEGCEDVWMGQGGPSYWLKHYRSDTQAALYPWVVRQALRASLVEAERLAAGDSLAEARVRLTSEAFAVSERFVEFVETRENLARAILVDSSAGRVGDHVRSLLDAERMARARFQEALASVRREHPLAFGTVSEADFLRSDWGPSAEWMLSGKSAVLGPELVTDHFWHLSPRPDQKIAGLVYAPGMPPGWSSRSEPWEGMVTRLETRTGRVERVLRMERNKFTLLQLVVSASEAESKMVLSIAIEGRMGGETELSLTGVWADAEGKAVSEGRRIDAPKGDWVKGTRLFLPLPAKPSGSTQIALSILVTNQQAEDWLELSLPSIRKSN